MGLFDGFKSALSSVGDTVGDAVGGIGKLGGAFGMTPEMQGKFASGGEGISGIMPFLQSLMAEDVDPEDVGEAAGKAQKAMMDEAYPGTNPWERLSTGQGGASAQVAQEQREKDERIADKTLSNQRSVAKINANASIIPSLIQQYPELGKALSKRMLSTDPGQDEPIGRSEINLKEFQTDLERSKVEISSFKAGTERLIAEVQKGRLDFDQAVHSVNVHFKDIELSQQYVGLITQAYRSTGDNLFSMLRTSLARIAGRSGAGYDEFFRELNNAISGSAGTKSGPTIPGSTSLPRTPRNPVMPPRRR